MKTLHSFKKLTFFLLIIVYLLILIGASVRASGAGMGCPDWPTCFGRLIPPISESQLPENYRKLYAPKLAKGESIEIFNASKTWTEYLNRLFGVFVGLTSLSLFGYAFLIKKHHPTLFWLAGGVFFLICLQGGIGAIVVATNLLPGMITFHMMMALLIVCLLIYLHFNTQQALSDYAYDQLDYQPNTSLSQFKLIYRLIAITFALMLLQILMGTQVREMIDFASKTTEVRSNWLALLGDLFYVHRSFSWVIILMNAILLWIINKYSPRNTFFYLQFTACLIIVLQVLSGSLLNHLSFPMIVQPFHLLGSTLILGIQFSLLCHSREHYQNKKFLDTF